jgi:Sec-independent protein secretion pathway component TatC
LFNLVVVIYPGLVMFPPMLSFLLTKMLPAAQPRIQDDVENVTYTPCSICSVTLSVGGAANGASVVYPSLLNFLAPFC